MNEYKYIKCVDKNDMEATAYQLKEFGWRYRKY
nr:MAG TPA: protein of unknown function (DUF1737) [Caudoviricetes sp.]